MGSLGGLPFAFEFRLEGGLGGMGFAFVWGLRGYIELRVVRVKRAWRFLQSGVFLHVRPYPKP